ncbi:MAG: peptide chain release factor N(5)-glutamine methyltransferase [Nitrospiraceae bacterium]|nr:MAG: peptide chain release factor N(5)-glutamine methyltransferase [Nitrospiraceae bacterium]
MKALDKLKEISTILASHASEPPDKEAEIILLHSSNLDLVTLYRDNPELTPEQINAIDRIVVRRTNHEPLQYITGYVDFMGLKLLVGKGVLIPRPETELMAENATNKVGAIHESPLHILDLCTGSGCLALALAKGFPDAMVYGVDISETALSYARRNAELNEISNVSFIRGNLFGPFQNPPVSPFSKGGLISPSNFFDLIISNPPYIKSEDIKDLQPEIKDWEPQNALDGGPDGLGYYRIIIPASRQFLKPNGMLMLELGIDCAGPVTAMLKDAGYKTIELIKDYAGVRRIAVAA